MTAAEFEKVAENLGPCELVRGEVVTLSPAVTNTIVPYPTCTACFGAGPPERARRVD